MAANQLPPIKTLFSESWEMLKGSFVHLLVLYVICFALFFALFIVGLLIGAPLGVFSVFSAIQNNGVTPSFFTSLGVLGIVILVLIVIAIVIATMIQAAMILMVANYKSKPSYGATLRQGLGFVLPLTLTAALTGFITTGALFLFIIPGLVLTLGFMFVNMEIVLNHQSGTSALKRSLGIVFSNFWGILGRSTIFFFIAIIIIIVPQALAGGTKNIAVTGLFGLLSMIVNIAVGWYGVAFSITLYKQASKNYSGTGVKLMWPMIIAIAGCIVGIIFISAVIGMITYFVSSEMTKRGGSQMQYNKELQMMLENPSQENVQKVIELLPTDSPERAELEKQMMDGKSF